jgi:5'(3')-deoxyribonucleotidase
LHLIFDFDNTIVDSAKALYLRYQEKFNDYTIEYNENKVDWDMQQLLPIPKSEVNKFFNEPEFFKYLKPFDNAIEVLTELKNEGHYLHLVTYHSLEGIQYKQKYINENLSIFDEITILPLTDKNLDNLDKSCVSGDIIIDDNIKALTTAKTNGKLCYGRYAWNKSWNGKRAKDWVEVKNLIKMYISKHTCEVCGSNSFVQYSYEVDKYLCGKHRNHIKFFGEIKQRTIKDLNEIIIKENFAEVILYNKECKEIARTIIDKDDVNKVKDIAWSVDNYGYAHTSGCHKRMHQYIINYDTNIYVIDHINRNKLDNRKINLRLCTKLENNRNIEIQKNNSSGFVGVHYDSNCRLWRARITVNYKSIYIGSYKTFDEAVKSRILAEIEYFGEYSPHADLLLELSNVELNPILKTPTNEVFGISWSKEKQRWHAYILINKKRKHLGYFKDKYEAIKARLLKEIETYGYDNAPQKHLFEQYNIDK